MASFLFSLWMLIKRDWTTYWRDIMKFGSMLLNTIMRFILIGVLYLNFIPERNIINIDPIKAFRAIQSLAFNCVASTIFISLYTVALSRKSSLTQYQPNANYFTNKLTLKNIQRYLIFFQKL